MPISADDPVERTNRPASSARRLIFIPEPRDSRAMGNSYVALMARAWEQAGYVILPKPGIREGIRLRSQTIAVANWIDDRLVDENGHYSILGLARFLKTITRLKLVASRVVFVRHNAYPHRTKPESVAPVQRAIRFAERRLFDDVLVHSTHLAIDGRSYLPHPLYTFSEPLTDAKPSTDLIYFGNFAPYKRLDQLITAWNRPTRLILAGECRDRAILQPLEELAKGREVVLENAWLDDTQAMRRIRECAALIVPHGGGTSVNISGSIYFGLACGVPVICVASPHAKSLREAGVTGIVCIDTLDELNHLDIDSLRSMSRDAIAEESRRRFGLASIAEMIRARFG